MKIVDRLAALPPEKQALFWQLFRYAVIGGGITAAQAALYWSLAALARLPPQLANLAGYVFAVALGFVLHSAFTFRGHGNGETSHARRGGRFITVSLLSYAANALWVWLFIALLKGPTWSPIPCMIFVTPLMVFTLNRQWVFR